MSQEIVRAKQWNQKTRVRSGMVVIFEDAYFLSDSGVNSQPTNGYDWIFLGTVEEMNGGSGNIKSFPTKDDFPVPGEESTIYLDLSTDLGYVWDFETEEYKGIGVDEARLIAIELKNTQQDLAIAGKMQKPDMPGFYFINQTGGAGFPTSFISINPSSYFITYWNGSSFQSSTIKQNATNIELGDPIILKKVTNDQMINLPSPVEGMIVFRTDLTKGIFNYQSGSWLPIGLNLGNSDLSNSSARTFAQGNSFTWNTAGFGYFWKGLADKTGQAAYSKSLIIHPTTGETVTRDFADPAATTLAVQNANASQKTAMRTALLGTAVPSPPTISGVSRMFIQKGIDEYTDMYGMNLTLLDPSFIYIELTPGGSRIYCSAFYNITPNAVRTLWNIPIGTPDGIYDIKIQNGVSVQGLSSGKLYVGVWNLVKRNILVADWIRRGSANGTVLDNTIVSGTTSNAGNLTPTQIFKSPNFLGCAENDVWEVNMQINYLINGGSGIGTAAPFVGLTPTTDAAFTTVGSFVQGEIMWLGYGVGGQGYVLNGSQYGSILLSSGLWFNLIFSKPIGNIVYVKLIRSDTGVVVYGQSTILNTTAILAVYYRIYAANYSDLNYQVIYDCKIKS